ncbi:MAG: hypothetical protein ACFFDS_07225 [Candidatus Thorarchaeota archaeon]
MTAIIEKENLKDSIFNEYNSLKGFMNLNSTEEEKIVSLLDHIAENLFNSKISSSQLFNMEIYENYLHKRNIKKQRNKFTCDFLLQKGSFI